MLPFPEDLRTMFAGGLGPLSSYFASPSTADIDPRLPLIGARRTEEWLQEYYSKACGRSFCHDEPWITLMALYGLFGDQTAVGSPSRIVAVNDLLSAVYSRKTSPSVGPQFRSISGVRVEVCLPENGLFQQYLRERIFAGTAYHPYADRREILQGKLDQGRGSLEGSTNLDALISGRDENGRWVHVFIEAKFLSDISKEISYLPVRNQIARNVDCAMDLMTDHGDNPDGLNDFWFLLLTPGMFRTPDYGGPIVSPLDVLCPWRSRLYCYKMDDYLHPDLVRRDLPHWNDRLSGKQWELAVSRIGWLAFEEVVGKVESASLLPASFGQAFHGFFRERGLARDGDWSRVRSGCE